MIQPISIKEYMDIIARQYKKLPDGKEKTELWKEIIRIAERCEPNIQVEEIKENKTDE